MRTINRFLLLILSLVSLVSCTELWHSGYAELFYYKNTVVFDATFELSNETGQDLFYRHVYNYKSPNDANTSGEKRVIECAIPSGASVVVGYSYWKYHFIHVEKNDEVFRLLYEGAISNDTRVDLFDSDSTLIISWKPQQGSSTFNIFDPSCWSYSKKKDGDFRHLKWSLVLDNTIVR